MKQLKVLLLVFLCLVVYACSNDVKDNTALLESYDLVAVTSDYADISVPMSWVTTTNNSGQVVLFSVAPIEQNGIYSNVNLTKEELNSKFSVASYKDAARNGLRSVFPNIKFLESDSNWHILEYVYQEKLMRQLQFFYVKGSTAFVLTFTSAPDFFDEQEGLFRAMEKSFALK